LPFLSAQGVEQAVGAVAVGCRVGEWLGDIFDSPFL
jgi:hypothetical protein